MEEEELKLEQTLNLFDLYWFRHHVLLLPPPSTTTTTTTTTTTPAAVVVLDVEEDARSNASEPLPTSSPRRPISRRRHSLSDQRDPFGSDPRLEHPRLETILSGKVTAEAGIGAAAAERGGYQRRRRRSSTTATTTTTTTTITTTTTRSLSDLEFEELKGLMDLGFTLSEAEAAADPRLVEIVPALRRRSLAGESTSPSTAEGGGDDDPAGVARPYLSEAWEDRRYVLKNWRIPVFGEEVDLKENLRLWAHTVASTVRQEKNISI